MQYRFLDFRIDPQTREFRRGNGPPQALSPKVFDCIVYLIEHRDRAIGRDELISAVWGRVDIADIQLGQLIRKARRTLDDDGNANGPILTIPRFGFRWAADTEIVERPESEPPSLPASPTQARAARRPRIVGKHAAFAAVVLLIIGVLIAVVFVTSGRSPHLANGPTPEAPADAESPSKQRIAVVPVHVGDGNPEYAWVRLGGMDLIGQRLHRAGLTVVPNSNTLAVVEAVHDKDQTFRKLHELTSASHVVFATARPASKGWKVHFELRGPDGSSESEVLANDIVSAIYRATDGILPALTTSVPQMPDEPVIESELLQRVEASFLVDDFAQADRILDAAPEELKALPHVQLAMARSETNGGRYLEAESRLHRLLATISLREDAVLNAEILLGLARAAYQLERPDDAIAHLDDAIAILVRSNESGLLGVAYNTRGGIYKSVGQFDYAADDYARARMALQSAGDALTLARVENNEGTLAIARGRRVSEAGVHFRNAAETFERFGATGQYAYTLVNLISTYNAALEIDKAVGTSSKVEALLSAIADSRIRYMLLYARGCALESAGQLAASRKIVAALRKPDFYDPRAIALSDALEARIELAQGRVDLAGKLALRAVAGLEGSGMVEEKSRSWLVAIRAFNQASDTGRSAAESTKFSEWAESLRIPHDSIPMIESRIAIAEIASAKGNHEDADQIYRTIFHVTGESGPDIAASVALSYGTALLDRGQFDLAEPVVGRVARWSASDFRCAALQARYYLAVGKKEVFEEFFAKAESLAGERNLRTVLPELAP